MSSANKNLSDVRDAQLEDVDKIQIGIIRSSWNENITRALLEGALSTLAEAGIKRENIKIENVPGGYELPMGAKLLMSHGSLDAVICLGCVVKGETDHDKYINQAVANGLMQLGLLSGIPCIFGLLTVNDQQQALERAGGKHGNKGVEAAATALNMIALKQKGAVKKQIGY